MLRKYGIVGQDSETGESIELIISADSIEDAAIKAGQRNLSVESIAALGGQTHPVHATQRPTPAMLKNSNISISNENSRIILRTPRHRWWLLILGIIILIVVPTYPIVALLFGVFFLILCFGALIPKVKKIPCHFLKLDSDKRFKNNVRLTFYGIVGFFFISVGSGQHVINVANSDVVTLVEQAEMAWRNNDNIKAIERLKLAEKIEHATNAEPIYELRVKMANAEVATMADEAEVAWINGDRAEAIRKLKQAEKIENATSFSPVHDLKRKMADEEVGIIMSDAIVAATCGKLEEATKKVDIAISVPDANDLGTARKLKYYLSLVEDSKQIKSLLMSLPENDFLSLRDKHVIPDAFISGYAGLDDLLSEKIKKMLNEVIIDRTKFYEDEILIRTAAISFVNNGFGQKVPYEKWNIMGVPRTLTGTNNSYWVAYIDKANVSFVSRKSDDVVIFVAFGEDKAKEFIAEEKKKREAQIEVGFSAWDGSHIGLTKIIKASMNDPESYKHVETTYWDMGDYLVVKTTFRGKNAFGGVVTNQVKAMTDINGNVISVIEQNE